MFLEDQIASETPHKILPWKLLDLAGEFQFKERGEYLRRRKMRLKLVDDLVDLQGLVGLQDSKDLLFGR